MSLVRNNANYDHRKFGQLTPHLQVANPTPEIHASRSRIHNITKMDERIDSDHDDDNNSTSLTSKRRRLEQEPERHGGVGVMKKNPTDNEIDIDDHPPKVVESLQSQTSPLPPTPQCWKCHGTGKKYQKSTKRHDGPQQCGVCNGLGYRAKSMQSQKLATSDGQIQSLRGYPPNHPKRLTSSNLLFSGPRAVWGRSRFVKDFFYKDNDKNKGDGGVHKDSAAADWIDLPVHLRPSRGEVVASLGCGDWRIYQKLDGNKLTVDDFICSWVACEEMNERRKRHLRGQQQQQQRDDSSVDNKRLDDDKTSAAADVDESDEDFMFGGIEQFSRTSNSSEGDQESKTSTTSPSPAPSSPPSSSYFFTHADLGTGCGSVLQMVLWAYLGQVRSVGVEAQDVSFECLRRGLIWNVGVDPTQPNTLVRIVKGDLRTWDGTIPVDKTDGKTNKDESQADFQPPYDLITGTPPYFPLDSFVASNNHNQKVRCRVPTRGGACDYIKTASRLLAHDGVFCMVEASFAKAEHAVLQAVARTNGVLTIKRRLDVVTRTGLPPRFSCWVMTKQKQKEPHNPQQQQQANMLTHEKPKHDFPIQTLTLRDVNLRRTNEYSRAMERMGWVDFEKYKEC